jgi:phosphoribosyl-ATP pyrophosphohydrolase
MGRVKQGYVTMPVYGRASSASLSPLSDDIISKNDFLARKEHYASGWISRLSQFLMASPQQTSIGQSYLDARQTENAVIGSALNKEDSFSSIKAWVDNVQSSPYENKLLTLHTGRVHSSLIMADSKDERRQKQSHVQKILTDMIGSFEDVFENNPENSPLDSQFATRLADEVSQINSKIKKEPSNIIENIFGKNKTVKDSLSSENTDQIFYKIILLNNKIRHKN